jgi:uncharacterized protein (TIGR03067 family)
MRSLALVTTLFAAAMLCAQGEGGKDLEKLNGVWVPTGVVNGGKKVPDEVIKDFKLTIKDGTFTARVGDMEGKGTIKIDTLKKPMTMDMLLETGPLKGKTQLAIYEFQGAQLKICIGDIDKKERPTNFDTENKPGVVTFVYKKMQ